MTQYLLFSAELFSDTRLSQQLTGGVLKYSEDWLAGVQRSSRQKKPLKSDQNGIIMQNKPNFMPFLSPKSRFHQKTNPNKPKNKPIFTPKNPLKAKTNPIQTQSNPTCPCMF
jgi:hypothetical protein